MHSTQNSYYSFFCNIKKYIFISIEQEALNHLNLNQIFKLSILMKH